MRPRPRGSGPWTSAICPWTSAVGRGPHSLSQGVSYGKAVSQNRVRHCHARGAGDRRTNQRGGEPPGFCSGTLLTGGQLTNGDGRWETTTEDVSGRDGWAGKPGHRAPGSPGNGPGRSCCVAERASLQRAQLTSVAPRARRVVDNVQSLRAQNGCKELFFLLGQDALGLGQDALGLGQDALGLGQSARSLGQGALGLRQHPRSLGQDARGLG